MRVTLEEAVRLLLQGEAVAIPTETVYGLAARYDDREAVKKVFALKKRPPANPLIIHLAESREVSRFVEALPEGVEALADAFWPGPLTLVLPIKTEAVPAVVRADLSTQAFRVPAHPLTRQLLTLTGPLVAPSANLSGRPSAVDPEHVEEDFGKAFPVLDGGRCGKGLESTILLFQHGVWMVGRLGSIPLEAFEKVLGYVPQLAQGGERPLCPGQMFRHYAPKANLSFHEDLSKAPAIIGFKCRVYPQGVPLFLLGDAEEAAFELYALLRELDRQGMKEAWIDAAVPKGGLWETVLERLRKAAHLV